MRRIRRGRLVLVAACGLPPLSFAACAGEREQTDAGGSTAGFRSADVAGCYALELGPWIPAGAGAWPSPSELPSPYELPSRLMLAPLEEGRLETLPLEWEGTRQPRRMSGRIEGDSLILETGGLALAFEVARDTLAGVARMWSPRARADDVFPYREAHAVRIHCETGEPTPTRLRPRRLRP